MSEPTEFLFYRVLPSNYKVKMTILHTYILTENISCSAGSGLLHVKRVQGLESYLSQVIMDIPNQHCVIIWHEFCWDTSQNRDIIRGFSTLHHIVSCSCYYNRLPCLILFVTTYTKLTLELVKPFRKINLKDFQLKVFKHSQYTTWPKTMA